LPSFKSLENNRPDSGVLGVYTRNLRINISGGWKIRVVSIQAPVTLVKLREHSQLNAYSFMRSRLFFAVSWTGTSSIIHSSTRGKDHKCVHVCHLFALHIVSSGCETSQRKENSWKWTRLSGLLAVTSGLWTLFNVT